MPVHDAAYSQIFETRFRSTSRSHHCIVLISATCRQRAGCSPKSSPLGVLWGNFWQATSNARGCKVYLASLLVSISLEGLTCAGAAATRFFEVREWSEGCGRGIPQCKKARSRQIPRSSDHCRDLVRDLLQPETPCVPCVVFTPSLPRLAGLQPTCTCACRGSCHRSLARSRMTDSVALLASHQSFTLKWLCKVGKIQQASLTACLRF